MKISLQINLLKLLIEQKCRNKPQIKLQLRKQTHMLLIKIQESVYRFGRVSQQLKLLNLKFPTNHNQIKSRYRELAKQYHPDTLKQTSTKQSQQYFIKITTAYNQLKQMDEKQLAGQDSSYDDVNMSQEQRQRVRTKQQQLRQQTYDYFNRRPATHAYKHMKKDPINQKPLYKTVPQLFIGLFFVFIIFGEWIYKSVKKTDIQISNMSKEKDNAVYNNVFQNFNAAKRFKSPSTNNRDEKILQIESSKKLQQI